MSPKEEYGDLQLKKEALIFQIKKIEERQNEIKFQMANENKKNNRPEGSGEAPAGGGELAPKLSE